MKLNRGCFIIGDFDLFRKLNIVNGKTSQERIINQKKNDFDNYIKNTPNRFEININNNQEKYLISVQDVTINNKYGDEKYIVTYNETPMNIGSIFDCLKLTWIIVEKEHNSLQDHQTFKARPCNNYITILTDENKIIQIPCIKTNATMYGDGITENKIMKLPDGMIKITVQKNEITNTFKRDMAFIFNHKDRYAITSTYTDIDSGLIDIIMREEAVNTEVDSLELNIANYKTKKHNYSIIVQNNLNVKVGEKYKISYQIKDNEQEVTDKEILDKIVLLTTNSDVITVDNQGFVTPLKKGKCTIELNLEIDNEKINALVQISVLEEESKNFNIEIISEDNEFTVDSLSDKTFRVVFKNNDEIVNDKATFSIRNKDAKVKEPLAIIKSFTDNSCVLKANAKARFGYVVLSIESQSGMCKVEKEIKVRNPFA